MYFALFPLTLLLACANCALHPTIIRNPSGVDLKYAEGVLGESGLRECTRFEACSVVHERFWKPNLCERLCRCPNNQDCNSEWTDDAGNFSMTLNNRSQLKFCAPVTELEECTSRQSAAVLNGKGDNDNSYLVPHNVTVNCYCPPFHYWRIYEYSYGDDDDVSQIYKCVKLRQCESEDFCGNVRADLFSVYYQCSCPFGHLCVFKEKREKRNVQELFYSGPAFRARCYDFRNDGV